MLASFVIALREAPQGYEFLYLLPLSYGILHFLFPTVWGYGKGNIGMKVFNIILFIRYVIVPFTRSLGGYYTGVASPLSESVQIGIWIMLYELLVTFIMIFFFAKKFYVKKDNGIKKINYINNNVILFGLLLLALGVLAMYPGLAARYNFVIFSEGIDRQSIDLNFSGFFSLLLDWGRFILPLLLVNHLSKKYYNTLKFRYVFLSIVIIIPNLLISVDASRFSILVPTISWSVLLGKLYPVYRKRIISFFALLSVVVLISLTLYKQFGYTTTNQSLSEPLDASVVAHTFDVYFSGVNNMGFAIDMTRKFDNVIDIKTFLNDLLYNTAFIGRNVDSNNLTPTWFNYAIYNSQGVVDQIIPISGQGYAYLGILLSPTFLVIALLLMMKLDGKLYKENRPEFIYLLTYMTVFLSMPMMLNVSIIKPIFTNMVFPLLLIFVVNRKISWVSPKKQQVSNTIQEA